MTGKTRAALYLRQSLDVTEGIDRQRERCSALAADRGWAVVATFTDNDVSASKPRGPKTAWGQMIADATQKKFSVVVAVDLDRLLRTNRDLVTLIDAGIRVATVDGEIDLASADGEFRAQMLAAVARFEVRRKSERQMRAQDARTARGIPAPGRRPYGYENDRVTPRESEAVWVRWAFERIEALDSLHSIVRELNARGVRTGSGKPWSSAQLKAVLRRPRNGGFLVARGQIQAESTITPLVSAEQYENVLRIIDARAGERMGRPTPERWASGLVTCTTCQRPLRPKKLSQAGAGGERQRVATYLCESRINRTETDDRRHLSIAASVLEGEIRREIISAFMSAPRDLLPRDGGPDVHALTAERETLSQRRADINMNVATGRTTNAEAAPALDALTEQIDAIDADLTRAAQSSAVASMLAGVQAYMFTDATGKRRASFEDAADARRMLGERFDALPVERRRDLAAQILDVHVRPGGKGKKRVSIIHKLAVSLNE